MTYSLVQCRAIPDDMPRGVATDSEGLKYPVVQLPDGRWMDRDAWRVHSDVVIPEGHPVEMTS